MDAPAGIRQPLSAWILRLRLHRAVAWALRGLIFGLAGALIVGALGLAQARILRAEFLWLVALGATLPPFIFGWIAALWQIRPLEAARRFDLLFRLDERISTALELIQQPQQTPPDLLARQLRDAANAAQTVDLRRQFPLRLAPREGLVVILLAAALSLAWFNGADRFQAAQQAAAVEKAVEEQVSQIEELIKEIEANPALTDEQKQALAEPLKQAQQSLEDNPTLENSVSVLTSTSEKLQELSDSQAQQLAESLQQAGDQLAKQDGSPLEQVGENLKQGDIVNAASELANIDVSELSPEEQAQLAEQLQSMAEGLKSTNPELANQLNQAAQDLQNGDAQAAQQALEDAAQSLAQAGQQVTSSQVAQQAANQLQEGAGQVITAGGGQQAGQAGQSGQGSNQGAQNSSEGGSGSGSGEDAGSNPNGSEAGSDPIDQTNQSDGGESTYEEIYAPQLLGGDGDQQVTLPSSGDDSGDVIGQGPVTPGEPGASTVPYSEVFSLYQQAYNEAIENGEAPPQFIDIIRNYFDSLEP
ncbi:MAG: hypothetical protein IT314_09815 [Anaerolineales bacterium]|nr:hypothetical protein [Anaerolineales bacterium]